MAQFTLKRLLIAFSIIAIGIGALASSHVIGVNLRLRLLFWFVSVPLIVAGCCSFYKRRPIAATVIGLAWGLVLQVIVFVTDPHWIIGTLFDIPQWL